MSRAQPEAPVRRPDRTMLRRKLIAAAFAAVPTAVFALFAIGEGIGAEPGWWGHLIQLALALTPTVLAWLWPRIGGPMLIIAGVGLAGFVLAMSAGALWPSLITVGIFCLPLVVSGVLFSRLGYGSPTSGPDDHPTE